MTTSMHRRKRPMISAALCALLSGLLLLSGCGKGPEAGTAAAGVCAVPGHAVIPSAAVLIPVGEKDLRLAAEAAVEFAGHGRFAGECQFSRSLPDRSEENSHPS